ncbi:tetratricopeptide repeat protein [Streptomyces rubiginosohelvolus]|uniref:tetratricopeptide repeat protein n=1 Tax=Streptomyces rubiginosohelvolus TaxID=67362 RepID=UPI0037210B95
MADRPALACIRAEAAVRLWRQIGSHTWLAVALDTLATAHTQAGDHPAVTRAHNEAAELRRA